jgi:hypothetical protein
MIGWDLVANNFVRNNWFPSKFVYNRRMQKRWKLRGEIEQQVEQELGDYPDLVRKLLFSRGIKTIPEAKKFLQTKSG